MQPAVTLTQKDIERLRRHLTGLAELSEALLANGFRSAVKRGRRRRRTQQQVAKTVAVKASRKRRETPAQPSPAV